MQGDCPAASPDEVGSMGANDKGGFFSRHCSAPQLAAVRSGPVDSASYLVPGPAILLFQIDIHDIIFSYKGEINRKSDRAIMISMAPNLRHLRAFCVVAEYQSISRASEKVVLSQPAITQPIAKLEQTLEIELFTRRTDGEFITDAGQLYLTRADRAQEFIRAGIDEARKIAQIRGGKSLANLDQLVSGVQLRALTAIAKTGNFSLAARLVGISQPSLYRAARDLERL